MTLVTFDSVSAAADQLVEDGKKPTQAAIRDLLGGGSFTSIGAELKKWNEARAEAEELAQIEIPERLEVAGRELFARMWTVALSEAHAGHDALRKELLQSQSDVKAAQDETASVAAALEADIEKKDSEISQLRGQVSDRDQSLSEMTSRAIDAEKLSAVLEERIQHLEKRATEAEARELELKEEIKVLRSEKSAQKSEMSAKAE